MAERDAFEERLHAHLAAPLPLRDGAADRVVASVRDRLDGTPPRRSLPLLAGVASGVLLAGILGAALWARTVPHARPDRPAPGVAAPPIVSPAPSGLGFSVDDAAFGDDVHGWEVGTACPVDGACRLAVRATSDGGRSWSAPAVVAGAGTVPPGSAQVAFSGRTGFVAAGGLFASTDGGRSWRDTGVTGDTVAVAPVGASVWAVQGCGSAQWCPLRIVASADGGRTWQSLATQPQLAGPGAQLVRVSASVAFLSGSASLSGDGSPLAVTHDGGRSWETLADPCSPYLRGAPPIAALEPTELWAACGSPAGNGGVSILRSRDGGEHWQQLAITAGPAGPGGGGAPRPVALALAPRGAAYLALDDGPLLRSGDGSDWRVSLGAGAGGVRRIDLLDTTHGWVVTATGRVLRTSDGGRTWNATAS